MVGVALRYLPQVRDQRGLLTFAEVSGQIPFSVKRCFLISDVPSKKVRGEHAHRKLHEILTCVHGRCHVMVDDGKIRQDFILDDPAIALYVPPMIWSIQHKFTRDAILLVLCSDRYDGADYIRDYAEFRKLKRLQ